MTKRQAKVSLLVLILLIAVCVHIDVLLGSKLPKRIASVTYPEKGIGFSFDKHGKVKRISIRRYRKDLISSTIPGENEILPGIGAFGIRLGDSADRVVEKLGTPDHWKKTKRRQVMRYRREFFVSFVFASGSSTITDIVIAKGDASTPEGIAISSSEEEVLNTYGDDAKIHKRTFSVATRIGNWAASSLFRSLYLGLCLWLIISRLPRIRRWKLIAIWIIVSFSLVVIVGNFSTLMLPIICTAAGVGIITGRIFFETHRSTKVWTRHLWGLAGSLVFYMVSCLIVILAFPRIGVRPFAFSRMYLLLLFPLILYLSFVIFEEFFKLSSKESGIMEMSPKPSKGVTAVGIIAIVLGGHSAMRTLGMMRELFFSHMPTRRTSLIEVINQGVFNCSVAYFKGRLFVGIILCLLLVISGVGILKLREWARKLMLGVSAISALLCLDYAVRNAALRVDSPIHVRFGMTFWILLCGLWFYILAVCILTRPTVREQFEETATRQKDS